ncbi:MAG: hypothetical protein M3Y28_02000 [Armatimonadota bacterium]|nr:hypothetical protein [Armatimonadota bacterium]
MTYVKRRRKLPLLKRLAQTVLAALALIALLYGFVYNTRIAIVNQEHGPIGAEHPWDWQAEGCLALALVLIAVLALTRPSPRRWRKTVRWQNNRGKGAKMRKRTRRERVQ